MSSAARCSTTSSSPASGPVSTPCSPAAWRVGDRSGWVRSPATGRRRTTHRGRWRHRSPPAARRCGREQRPRPKATWAERSSCGTPSRTPAPLAGLDHPALLVETAIAAEHARHLERGIELDLQAVAELAGVDPMREAEVWLQLRDLYRFLNRWDDCAVTVARALELIPESPPSSARAEALANAALSEVVANHTAEAMAYARQAIAAAEAVGDPDMVVKAYDTPGGGAGRGRRRRRRARRRARQPESMWSRRLPRTHHRRVQHGDRRDDRCRPDTPRSPPTPNAPSSWRAPPDSAVPVPGGSPTVGSSPSSCSEDGPKPSSSSASSPICSTTRQRRATSPVRWGVALIRQGRLDEARPLIEQARAALARGNWSESVAWLAAAVVTFDAAEGRYGDAEALVNEVIDRDRPSLDGNSYLVAAATTALADCAPARRHDDTNEQVITTATRWIEWMETVEHDGRRPTVEQQLYRDHAMAELQRLRGQPDPQAWAQLAAGWERIGFRYDEAHARFRHAEALLAGTPGRRRGGTASRHRRPQSRLRRRSRTRRHTAADRHRRPRPSSPSARRHDRILRLDSATRTDAMALGLTPREHEVLALLARGRSNGEIAKALFITTKTASVHVSNILRKLDVTNRVEAANLAHLTAVPPESVRAPLDRTPRQRTPSARLPKQRVDTTHTADGASHPCPAARPNARA